MLNLHFLANGMIRQDYAFPVKIVCRLEKVESPAPAAPEAPAPEPKTPARNSGSPKVISLAELKKDK